MRASTHKLLVSDSRKLPSIPDESIGLVVTSPPYPMIAMWDEMFGEQSPRVTQALSEGNHPTAFEAMHTLLDPVWQECLRVLCPGGFLCINIGDAVRSDAEQFRLHSNHSRVIASIAGLGFTLIPSIVWRKPTNSPTKFMGSGMLPGGAYVTLEHEHILIGRKGTPRRPSTKEERALRRESALFWEERNEWYSDLWTLGGVRQSLTSDSGAARPRSAAFPFALPYRIFSMYSWIGDTILDPFGGTGTSALAAAGLGRDSITVDSDTTMIETARSSLTSNAVREFIQDWTVARIGRHRDFIETRHGGAGGGRLREEAKHRNQRYGFPVVTSQETDLRLRYLDQVNTEGDEIQCTYTDVPIE